MHTVLQGHNRDTFVPIENKCCSMTMQITHLSTVTDFKIIILISGGFGCDISNDLLQRGFQRRCL